MIRAQSNVLAQRPIVPRLSRTPAQGAPPNHTQPPHPGCSTGPVSFSSFKSLLEFTLFSKTYYDTVIDNKKRQIWSLSQFLEGSS